MTSYATETEARLARALFLLVCAAEHACDVLEGREEDQAAEALEAALEQSKLLLLASQGRPS